MIELVPFKAEHYLAMELQPHDEKLRDFPEYIEGLRAAEVPNLSYTAVEDGKVLGVGGIRRYWPGVGEAWAVFPKDVKRHGRDIYRVALTALDLWHEAGFWRIQAVAHCGWDAAVSFMLALKFKVEGRLVKYGVDRADYYMMARTI